MRSWYKKVGLRKEKIFKVEIKKIILKSLLKNNFLGLMPKIYLMSMFNKFTKITSIAFLRRSCVITGNSRSVFFNFKMVRHQCKFFASNGYVVGLRKASF